MKSSLHKLLTAIDEIELESTETKTASGEFIFELLSTANIREADVFLIEKLADTLLESKEPNAPQGVGLNAMTNFLKVVYTSAASQLKDRIDAFFRVFVEEKPAPYQSQATQKGDAKSRVVNFWCFSAAFG